ncbi:hypothetical protein R3Y73_04500 [Bacillus velezensis]|uniref:hypothetical protein n=1 Tax=Bacillus TaxID=1386 RepID=UPI0012AC27A3|nr:MULTISPECIES: hypothetical protein [Bacillus]MCD7911605.1 hypothetical protein [Bacillus velezensis]MCQ9193115.1 hypothetical protein [Bacillus velezensis]MCX2917309.1 hypothetical protein [Bacillus velezensis]MCY6276203.1 hypothetical protein [Bacillus sp. NEAU-16]NVE04473.1 hypothetical protein [Bacillus velezensis]
METLFNSGYLGVAEKVTSTTSSISSSIWIPIATILAALIGAWISGRVAKKAALKSTISTERILWMNNLRDQFVDFNKLAYAYSSNKNTIEKNKEKNDFDFTEKHYELRALCDRINLLLNPNEEFSDRLSKKLVKIIGLLTGDYNYNVKAYDNHIKELNLIQQVILKAEWKRIKIEIKKGEELSDKKIAKIYKEKAISLGLEKKDEKHKFFRKIKRKFEWKKKNK